MAAATSSRPSSSASASTYASASASDAGREDTNDTTSFPFTIPALFTSQPPIRDTLESYSSDLQDQTIDECLPYLSARGHQSGAAASERNAHGLPPLDRARHLAFLHRQLARLPGAFTPADPSRPWMLYWCLSGLALLGEDVSARYRQQLVDTVRPMQNRTGGFAGGFGQTSHLATTYASVLSLALVGGRDAYDLVDRRAMWEWLCSLKQLDGGFKMAVGGEEDVR